VVSVTEAIRAAIVQYSPSLASRVSVAGNGIEVEWLEDLPPVEAPRGPVDRRIVFTGNLAAYQRLDLLFRAFRRVAAERPDVRLRIVTEGKPEEVWRHARQSGVVANTDVITGGFEVARAELALAYVAANPRTVCDGVPQKMLNYMAAGVGIVSCEGSAALLEHEVTGLVVRNDDDEAFADAMLRLLDHPELRRSLGGHAREAVRARTWDATAERVESVYDAVLGPAGRGARAWPS
jgi:glycosyltransferase involved in cell wall biosynthesis